MLFLTLFDIQQVLGFVFLRLICSVCVSFAIHIQAQTNKQKIEGMNEMKIDRQHMKEEFNPEKVLNSDRVRNHEM